jgi:hypothetical protein
MPMGKFQGAMRAATPRGSCTVNRLFPATGDGITSPYALETKKRIIWFGINSMSASLGSGDGFNYDSVPSDNKHPGAKGVTLECILHIFVRLYNIRIA